MSHPVTAVILIACYFAYAQAIRCTGETGPIGPCANVTALSHSLDCPNEGPAVMVTCGENAESKITCLPVTQEAGSDSCTAYIPFANGGFACRPYVNESICNILFGSELNSGMSGYTVIFGAQSQPISLSETNFGSNANAAFIVPYAGIVSSLLIQVQVSSAQQQDPPPYNNITLHAGVLQAPFGSTTFTPLPGTDLTLSPSIITNPGPRPAVVTGKLNIQSTAFPENTQLIVVIWAESVDPISSVLASIGGSMTLSWINAKCNGINSSSSNETIVVLAGRDGINGEDGTDGTNGQSCYSFVEPPGTNCTLGGLRFYCPADSVEPNKFSCKIQGPSGIDGKNGTDGRDGTDGTNGQSCYSFVEPSGTNCTLGGLRFYCPADSIEPNKFSCKIQGPRGIDGKNGTDGLNGKNGINGSAALLTAGDATISAVVGSGNSIAIEATGSFGSKAISTTGAVDTGSITNHGAFNSDYAPLYGGSDHGYQFFSNGQGVVTIRGDLDVGFIGASVIQISTTLESQSRNFYLDANSGDLSGGNIIAGGFAEIYSFLSLLQGPPQVGAGYGILFHTDSVAAPYLDIPAQSYYINCNTAPTSTIFTTLDDIKTPFGFIVASSRNSTTQSGSITSTVTAPGSSGIITTVSSTLTTGSSTTFVVKNPYYTSSKQVIQLTPEYLGSAGGIPYLLITNTNSASNQFTISITNIGPVTFNSNVLIHYSIN